MTTIATVEAIRAQANPGSPRSTSVAAVARSARLEHAVVGQDPAERAHDQSGDDRGGRQRGRQQVAAPQDEDEGGEYRQGRRDDQRQADQGLLDAVGQLGEVAGDVLFDAAHGVLGVDGDRQPDRDQPDAA